MKNELITSNYYKKLSRKVQCTLCPNFCVLKEGQGGLCRVRFNIGGKVKAKNFGLVSGYVIDPIEKKPLYHFYPGKKILSVGSFGCNLRCNFCQNWQISQDCELDMPGAMYTNTEEILKDATQIEDNIGLAYTYNEPTVWFEFMLELARQIKNAGLKNVMVTNGYINPEPLLELLICIDAFNVDLKAFTNGFYQEITGGELKPVLQTLKVLAEWGKHVELTTLVIPGKNDNVDDFQAMVSWIADNMGGDTVLHLSRYYPRFKQTIPATDEKVLLYLKEIAQKKLSYVYLGNSNYMANTHCSNCNTLMVERSGYNIAKTVDLRNGKCNVCNNAIFNYYE